MRPRTVLPVVLGLLVPLALACSAEESTTVPAESADPAGSEGHGDFAGAVELDEPALGLTTVDSAGVVRHLDLLDGQVDELADLGSASAVHTDGRFAFVQSGDGVEVVDSGVWTWDHVDHLHYYRADPRVVGRVEGRGPATVATTGSSTSGGAGVFFAGSGEAVLLDVGALSDGELTETFRTTTTPHDGMLVPVGDVALLTEPDRTGTPSHVVVLDADGDPVPGGRHACPAAAGTTTTRVGAVIGCADGALLAEVVDDQVEVTRIPYPRGVTAPPATSFHGRDGRPTVAALAGPDRFWLLDTREASWALVDPPVPLVQVSAVDDADGTVLGLTTAGRVVVLDAASGAVRATSAPLAARSLRRGTAVPPLVVDQQRAYLSAPVERRLHEIDFADDARVARTFETSSAPALLAGTGR
ncbi:MAG: transporter [Nocardioides sp.]|nr:transporter [Nocardioides sp.]